MKLETMAVKNFKTLCDIRLENIPRLCVFIGADGSGKTTLFDVFGFLKDCLTHNGIIEQMKQRVPGIGYIRPESTADGRLLLKCIRLWCSLLLFNQLSFLMMCPARYSFISLRKEYYRLPILYARRAGFLSILP